MSKEIKVINFVFVVNGKINLVAIEQFINYDLENAKVKILFDEKYTEMNINYIKIEENKLIFDNVIITPTELEIHYEKLNLLIKIDNSELIKEFVKESKGKNNYILFDERKYEGKINDVNYTDKIMIDFESIINICDEYFKIYCLDFENFSATFTMIGHDYKSPSIYLKYKDSEFKNKKTANIYEEKILKLSKYKYIVRSSNYWRLNVRTNKTFKANSSIIPFKYQKGTLRLIMKKNLFKNNLNALGKEILFITYKYI